MKWVPICSGLFLSCSFSFVLFYVSIIGKPPVDQRLAHPINPFCTEYVYLPIIFDWLPKSSPHFEMVYFFCNDQQQKCRTKGKVNVSLDLCDKQKERSKTQGSQGRISQSELFECTLLGLCARFRLSMSFSSFSTIARKMEFCFCQPHYLVRM